jgi:hypothetical protein
LQSLNRKVLKIVEANIVALGRGEEQAVLIVDDLVDTGKTAKVCAASAHFCDRLRQNHGPAHGRHLHNRGVAGHLDLFSVGHRLGFPAADPRRGSLNISRGWRT